MMLTLDDAQLKQFDEEGWLFFEDVLTQTKLRSSIARPAGFSRWTAKKYFARKTGRPRVPPLQHRIIMTSIIAWADIRDW